MMEEMEAEMINLQVVFEYDTTQLEQTISVETAY